MSVKGTDVKTKNMKKTLILLFALFCLSSVNLFAGKPLSVKSGEISVLKKTSIALLEIDYSSTKVGTLTLDEYLKKRGDDFVRDWPQDKAKAALYFKERFNSKNKGMQVTTESTDVTYKIVIHVNSLDMGNGAGTFLPFSSAKAGGVIMTGTIGIIDMKTNEVVCLLSVNEVKGLGHPSETIRLGLMYFELATTICKLK